jgi:hypothetical protein
MALLPLALAAYVGFVLLRARLRPTVACRRCAGAGCRRCRFTGTRIRAAARLVHHNSK